MFRRSRKDNDRPVRRLSKKPEGIIPQAASPSGSIAQEKPIAKLRKDRAANLAQLNNGIPRDLTEREWKLVPHLQNWSIHVPNDSPTLEDPNVESVRPAPLILQKGRKPTPTPSETSSNDSYRRSPTEGPFSWPRPPSRRSEPPTPSTTEDYLSQLPAPRLDRIYQNRNVKDILTGPENYSWWAMSKKRQFVEMNAWLLISKDLSPLPGSSNYHVAFGRLRKKVWFGIIESVSPEIRRVLNADYNWNPRGAWFYLEKTYASVSATTLCSVKGLRDMLDLKFEECGSLTDFLGLMVRFSRAIECNQQGKQGTEWLWCQFILMKLGPKWGPWVADLMDRIEQSDSQLELLVDMHRLVQELLNEDELRTQAELQRRAIAGKY